jgi:hypothetical protein
MPEFQAIPSSGRPASTYSPLGLFLVAVFPPDTGTWAPSLASHQTGCYRRRQQPCPASIENSMWHSENGDAISN